MQYIDIHTHQYTEVEKFSSSKCSCYNEIVGREQPIPGRLCSVGIHPWYIQGDGKEQLRLLWGRGKQPEVCMIGEAGLDKCVETPFELQLKVFEEQVVYADELQKPLVVHCVKAWQELLAVHRRFHPSVPWLIHGFRGKEPLARQLLRKGFYLSFGEHFHEGAVRAAWEGHLFVETDESLLGIAEIYQRLSLVLNCSLPDFQEQVARNFAALIDKYR